MDGAGNLRNLARAFFLVSLFVVVFLHPHCHASPYLNTPLHTRDLSSGVRSITAQAVPQVSWSARLADTELVGRIMASRLAPEEAALSAEPALLAAAAAGGLAVVGGLAGGGSAIGLLWRAIAIVVVVVVGLLAEVAEGALEVFLGGYSTIS